MEREATLYVYYQDHPMTVIHCTVTMDHERLELEYFDEDEDEDIVWAMSAVDDDGREFEGGSPQTGGYGSLIFTEDGSSAHGPWNEWKETGAWMLELEPEEEEDEEDEDEPEQGVAVDDEHEPEGDEPESSDDDS